MKAHTSIREEYQSGLVKMMAIGLAKHRGAAMTHSLGTLNLGPNMVRVGKAALEKLKITAGISVIENGYEELADVYVTGKEEILETEPQILKRAAAMIPGILAQDMDCLIVWEQGKNISGTGMHPEIARIPATMETDKLVFRACVKSCGELRNDKVKLVIVRSTKALEEVYMSQAALETVEDPDRILVCSGFMDVPFDDEGNLQLF